MIYAAQQLKMYMEMRDEFMVDQTIHQLVLELGGDPSLLNNMPVPLQVLYLLACGFAR